MSIDAALQINEVSLIAQRPLETLPVIKTLGSPNGFDLVTQSEETGDYLSIDKAYELYKISADSEANLIGRWDIELGDPAQSREIIALARSNLRTRFFSPASPNFFDERATRYVPSGRPFYLNVGAVNLNDAPVPDLSPGLTLTSLESPLHLLMTVKGGTSLRAMDFMRPLQMSGCCLEPMKRCSSSPWLAGPRSGSANGTISLRARCRPSI